MTEVHPAPTKGDKLVLATARQYVTSREQIQQRFADLLNDGDFT